ncbi:MAG: DUF6036 family nucleotidyltransferase [Deltaproteobacteria bacterium]|nr:DUF6036 family nucleotidyltransferase [Deltaproteobacteria bacterium]
MKEMTKKEVLEIFDTIDQELGKTKKKIQITVLGGSAVILQDFRERSTRDIDIAPSANAELFAKLCKKLDVPVDIITISSTVDLAVAKTIPQFSGKYLSVHSVIAEDLIKLKLERFFKHDPEDIMAIIDKTTFPYLAFKKLFQEMLLDFIGNPTPLILSAQEIVERKYSENIHDFEKLNRIGP